MNWKTLLPLIVLPTLVAPNVVSAQWVRLVQFQSPPDMSLEVTALNVDNGSIFACTRGRGIFVSRDSGTTWISANGGITDTFTLGIRRLSGGLYAGTFWKGAFLSTDNGVTWVEINKGLSNERVYSFVENEGIIYAATYGGVFKSTDAGMNWVEANRGIIYKHMQAFAVSGTEVFSSSVGGIYRTSDHGVNWFEADSGLIQPHVYVLAQGNGILFAGTDSGMYRSLDEGHSWTPANNGLTCLRITSIANYGSMVFAGTFSGQPGNTGTIFLSTDAGDHWRQVNQNVPANGGTTAVAVDKGFVYIGNGIGEIWARPLRELTSSVEHGSNEIEPGDFRLETFPNPAHERATVTIAIPQRSEVAIGLYDMQGRAVSVFPREVLEEGVHRRVFILPAGMTGAFICSMITDRGFRFEKLFVY